MNIKLHDQDYKQMLELDDLTFLLEELEKLHIHFNNEKECQIFWEEVYRILIDLRIEWEKFRKFLKESYQLDTEDFSLALDGFIVYDNNK